MTIPTQIGPTPNSLTTNRGKKARKPAWVVPLSAASMHTNQTRTSRTTRERPAT